MKSRGRYVSSFQWTLKLEAFDRQGVGKPALQEMLVLQGGEDMQFWVWMESRMGWLVMGTCWADEAGIQSTTNNRCNDEYLFVFLLANQLLFAWLPSSVCCVWCWAFKGGWRVGSVFNIKEVVDSLDGYSWMRFPNLDSVNKEGKKDGGRDHGEEKLFFRGW